MLSTFANSGYLSGSSPMFNSTTGHLHHLRIARHTFYLLHCPLVENGRLPRMESNRGAHVCRDTLYNTSTGGTRARVKRVWGIDFWVCALPRDIDPFDLLRPPSSVAPTEREGLHSHVNSRGLVCMKIDARPRARFFVGSARERERQREGE